MRNYRLLLTSVDVLLILLAAFFASRMIVSLWLTGPLPPQPPAVSTGKVATAGNESTPTDTGAILEKNLFGSRIDRSPRTPSGISDEDLEKLPESNLPLKLLGTVVQQTGVGSFAVIQETGTRQQQLYFTGEEIQEGVVLASVSRNRVVLLRNGQEEILEKDEDPTPSPSPRRAAASAARQKVASRKQASTEDIGVRKTGDNNYVMDRREVEGVLQDFNKLLTQIRVVPHFSDGNPDGFKIFNIRPGSLFAQLGMVNGDIIKRVNGLDITGPEQALQMFTQLRDESRVTVDLERFRKNITLQYDIR